MFRFIVTTVMICKIYWLSSSETQQSDRFCCTLLSLFYPIWGVVIHKVLTLGRQRAGAVLWGARSLDRSGSCAGRRTAHRCAPRHRWGVVAARRWAAATDAWPLRAAAAAATACGCASAAADGLRPRPPSQWRPGWPASVAVHAASSARPLHQPSPNVRLRVTSRLSTTAPLTEPSPFVLACRNAHVPTRPPFPAYSARCAPETLDFARWLANRLDCCSLKQCPLLVHKNQLKMIRQLSSFAMCSIALLSVSGDVRASFGRNRVETNDLKIWLSKMIVSWK